MRKWIVLVLMGLLAATLWSCGSGGFDGIQNIVVTVAPSTVTLAPRATQTFTASVTGTALTGVTWGVQEGNGGSIDANGAYTAPSVTGTFHVVATSLTDTSKTGVAVVTIGAATVTPATVTLPEGTTQTFVFSLGGTPNTNVNWTVSEDSAGTITPLGVYTAPNRIGTFRVFATTQTAPPIQASATIIVTNSSTGGPQPAFIVVNNSPSSSVGFVFPDSSVKAGAKVTWQNRSTASHCIIWDQYTPGSSPGPGANIGVFASGANSSVWTAPTVTGATIYHYHCCIHGTLMAGQITVNP